MEWLGLGDARMDSIWQWKFGTRLEMWSMSSEQFKHPVECIVDYFPGSNVCISRNDRALFTGIGYLSFL